jgi:hypothetical protein
MREDEWMLGILGVAFVAFAGFILWASHVQDELHRSAGENCVASHVETHIQSVQVGTVSAPIITQRTVCDRWSRPTEFPPPLSR